MRNIYLAFILLFFFYCQKPHVSPSELEWTGENKGNLKGYFYLSNKNRKFTNYSILVVLHGCDGSAYQISKAGWHELVANKPVLVLYPEQKQANHKKKCFNWNKPADSQRGKGEVHTIHEMISYVQKKYGITEKNYFHII